MEPAMEPETLEARINRATNPLNKELDWASINGFCEQLNEDFEGPPLATRLLAHKIQSPQEWEAIQALTVLETCMKSCGKRFHDEVGKFRFLNELIKVVSPKYLGSRTSEKVKNKILELLYSWTVGLPEEVKIAEAYQMLKKQGIVKSDPKLPDDTTFPLPPPRPKNVIFEDEEKSKMLARLLKSSHPEDLRAANKLIKEMVQEDQKRMEKISKRVNAIEEVNNNVKLLTEMVMSHSQGGAAAGSSEDLMKELYQRCERMRPTLFRLASDTEDNDEALGLSDPTPPSGLSLDGTGWNSFQSSDATEPPAPALAQAPSMESRPPAQTSLPASSGLDDLDLLGKTLLQQSLPPESQQVRWEKQQPAPRLTLRDLQNKSSSCSSPSSSATSLLHTVSPEPPKPPQQPIPTELSLASITVPLESIKPSSILPVTVYDQHGFRVLFHFARDPLPGRSDVLVVVVSMLSTAPQPIRNIVFQSAVPKVMKVKLQPPSGTELPAFNPIVHPSAITQVLLLANPQKEKVRLRYKLTFTMGDQTYNEMGDVDQFPAPETWGSL
ncbi:ADP-ribosylation factor-binding protein GGA1 isoform X3 [Papio anubis]|uniref:Golgi associated, gamma adaptin ear containing, ARF binding protein 1 n=5 Tax=Cercopithecidae TaxID=9527 RepID=A0A2K5MY00_CERAT|nr:PREDICTED: ADP-ribosylation factor-binding protein GGA1 isoform X3 [Cercocebus atys]XP_021777223.1 ADP-ribosylation factor-binding protein GGA1 isoform X3 [Papio anubis]XP_025254526.1 ADP-ribosylation factor-binding protein GGA1 isoform X5 [Theropithecus gelada]